AELAGGQADPGATPEPGTAGAAVGEATPAGGVGDGAGASGGDALRWWCQHLVAAEAGNGAVRGPGRAARGGPAGAAGGGARGPRRRQAGARGAGWCGGRRGTAPGGGGTGQGSGDGTTPPGGALAGDRRQGRAFRLGTNRSGLCGSVPVVRAGRGPGRSRAS